MMIRFGPGLRCSMYVYQHVIHEVSRFLSRFSGKCARFFGDFERIFFFTVFGLIPPHFDHTGHLGSARLLEQREGVTVEQRAKMGTWNSGGGRNRWTLCPDLTGGGGVQEAG